MLYLQLPLFRDFLFQLAARNFICTSYMIHTVVEYWLEREITVSVYIDPKIFIIAREPTILVCRSIYPMSCLPLNKIVLQTLFQYF